MILSSHHIHPACACPSYTMRNRMRGEAIFVCQACMDTHMLVQLDYVGCAITPYTAFLFISVLFLAACMPRNPPLPSEAVEIGGINKGTHIRCTLCQCSAGGKSSSPALDYLRGRVLCVAPSNWPYTEYKFSGNQVSQCLMTKYQVVVMTQYMIIRQFFQHRLMTTSQSEDNWFPSCSIML